MSLYTDLSSSKTEEEVKDAYIRALGLKGVRKNLVDIQTDEVWFEAKNKATSTLAMFTQLLHYVADARIKGSQAIAPILCVIDPVKAAVMRTVDVLPLLDRNTIKWGKSASQYTQEALEEVSNYIEIHLVTFVIEVNESEFISTMKQAIATGDIQRIQITPDNLTLVFDRWCDLIGKEISGVSKEDYALLFFADIMNDGEKAILALPAEVYHSGTNTVFFHGDKKHTLLNKDGYHKFWSVYDRPPKKEYRSSLLERRDSLIPEDERSIKGAFFTPLKLVNRAYDYLDNNLGQAWQRDYVVWDMCCGTGNLEANHNYPRNVFMSTLDATDINIIKSSKSCIGSEIFQYDYLNDDVNSQGEIDYNLTNKLPKTLRKAIEEAKAGTKKMLILINPPYAAAGAFFSGNTTKKGVSKTKWAEYGMRGSGRSSNELFVQFLTRIQKEIPNATVAIFSKIKYVNTESFLDFQKRWTGSFLDGFIVHSKVFDDLKGDFPISFLIWKLGTGTTLQDKQPIQVSVLNRSCNPVSTKLFYPWANNKSLNSWIDRPRAEDIPCIPLKNTASPSTSKKVLAKWHHKAIGYICSHGNDMGIAQQLTMLLSSTFGDGGGFYVTEDNLPKAAITFAARRSVTLTWINERDQYYAPSSLPSQDLENDSLIYMLFSPSNLTAGADNLQWDQKSWSLVNHFIPFTELELKASGRFESSFMSDYLKTRKPLTKEAATVMNEGLKLWQAFFEDTDDQATRTQLNLGRPDVGWYQVRKALEIRNRKSYTSKKVSFDAFEVAYKALESKLVPQFVALGIIK